MSTRPRLADIEEGRFGRLFPELAPLVADDERLLALGAKDGPLEVGFDPDDPHEAHNPNIPAGWPFFGQFIAHDITHDRDPLGNPKDLERVMNFRSPRFDLDSLYGSGPVGQPYLYDADDPDLLLVGLDDRGEPFDLPRNRQGLAVISDARNDVHLFIGQLHVAFLRFHNAVLRLLRESGVAPADVFVEAQRLVRWHYQWIVVNEYLRQSCGDAMIDDILEHGPRVCVFDQRSFIPVEFSDGAFRFGHAQIQATYDVNDDLRAVPLFPDLVGTSVVTAERRVDWTRLFAFPGLPAPQPSRRIRSDLVHPLMALPARLVGAVARPEFASLAARDLVRGNSVGLPSGEAVARLLGVTPCTTVELALPASVWDGETPLWLYVLKEAELQHSGARLGDVGGRIVAEVLLGLLTSDPRSYLRAGGGWTPELADSSGSFTMAHLLAVAGVAPEPVASASAPVAPGCTHLDQIADVAPDADGCTDCRAIGSRWVHLRECMTCGRVACCDSSPNRHATAHHRATGHPIARSIEPGESWLWCYVDRLFV